MAASNPFVVVVSDVQALIAKIKSGLQWFGAEAAAGIAWVDKTLPGAQQAFANLFQIADTSATALDGLAKTGLSDVVAAAIDGGEEYVANILGGMGSSPAVLAAKTILTAADVATATNAQQLATSAINVAFAKILGATAQIASAANTANEGPGRTTVAAAVSAVPNGNLTQAA